MLSGNFLSGRPPQLLITDAYNASYIQARRKLRDEQLLSKFIYLQSSCVCTYVIWLDSGSVLHLK